MGFTHEYVATFAPVSWSGFSLVVKDSLNGDTLRFGVSSPLRSSDQALVWVEDAAVSSRATELYVQQFGPMPEGYKWVGFRTATATDTTAYRARFPGDTAKVTAVLTVSSAVSPDPLVDPPTHTGCYFADDCNLEELYGVSGQRVPILSEWGVILLGIMLLSSGAYYIWRRRRHASMTV